ncbi:hypothetical protein FE236_12355 [Mariprofundus erugo]|nr:hypothetical protein [Mariprofundus erugo]TLS74013.1 hypothetical protein FE236_12355 [Mariprofundus erugo]
MQILTTPSQWIDGRGSISLAEQMIASLTGLHTVFKPLYTLAGKPMDGSRAQCLCRTHAAAVGDGDGQACVCMLNALRSFAAQQMPGYLYLDATLAELVDEQYAAMLLTTAGMLAIDAGRLVVVVTGDEAPNMPIRAIPASVARLRSAGVVIAAAMLRGGNLQLALIEQLQPQCLMLYADQRYCLSPATVASMLVLLPRMIGRAGCSVMCDYVD